jgi:dipeptidyl-peptidase 4
MATGVPRSPLATAFSVGLSLLVVAGVPSVLTGQSPTTPLEDSGHRVFTTHDGMVRYLAELQSVSPDMALDIYGHTLQGRELLVATFSRPRVNSALEAHATGRPIVLLAANAHGYNYLIRESLLVLSRELGTPGTELNALLDHVVVLVVPSLNPDGVELDTRPNAAGSDLNRDYMTLDQPESAAFVGRLLNGWDPHIYVDGHDGGAVQYGGAYPYSLHFQSSGLAGADASLTALADQEIFPLLQRNFQAQGLEAFYWARGDGERWYGGGAEPRMGRNYGGLANKVTLLFELAEWHETQRAVEIGALAYGSVLEYARDHAGTLQATVDRARRRTVQMGEAGEGQIPVRETLEADDFRVSYQLQAPDGSGGLITVEDTEIRKRPVPTLLRDRPWGYLLPPGAEAAVDLLRRHGIAVERLVDPAQIRVRRYTLAGVRHVAGVNGNVAALQVDVGAEVDGEVEVPRGSFLVRTGQPLGRVVTHLLEPETGDGLVHWNRLTHLLPLVEFQAHREDPDAHPAPVFPLLKVMERAALPAVGVR